MDKNHKNTNTDFYRILAGIFAAFVLVFFISGLVLPDKEMSAKEKRMLTQFKDLSAGRILSGDFSDDFEEYASDQIPLRDAFTALKVDVDLAAGRKESEGVYLCCDGSLMEKMADPDEMTVEITLSAINGFSEKISAAPLFVLVPNAVSIYPEKLPAFAVTADQAAFSQMIQEKLSRSGIPVLDLTGTMLQEKEVQEQKTEEELITSKKDLYYKTDHHWTTYAAKLCAPTILENLGRGFTDDYTPLVVCDDFNGSLSAKSGLSYGTTDEITVYAPADEPVYLVTGSEGEGKRATVYSEEGLDSDDPYTVFLGGNEGLLHIETDRIGMGRLLVFKDSYFNCFLPFLLRSYETIDVVDPRYFSGDLEAMLYQTDYDQVLYFYNMNTLAEDTSLSLVLSEAV